MSGVVVSLKVMLVLVSLFGVALPMMAWLERKQLALIQGRTRPSRVTLVGLGVSAILEPLAQGLKWLGKRDVVPASANPWLHVSAPLVALLPPVIGFGVIPFAGHYDFGSTTVSFVIADLDWGILFVIAMVSLASFGPIVAGWTSPNPWSQLGALRALAKTLSATVVLALAFVPMVLVFGTLRLGAIGAAQDRVFQLRTLPTWLGFDPVVEGAVEGGFGYLGLPAWGFLLQPVAFVLVLIAVSLHVDRRSADASPELLGGFRAAYGGLPFALFRLAEHVRLLLMSCVITSVFLGGWTIPYLSQATIVAAVAHFYDGEFANLVCVVLHVATYALKVGVLVFAQLLLANVLPTQRYDQMMKLCWKVLLPLGLVNVFATAVGILVWGGPA